MDSLRHWISKHPKARYVLVFIAIEAALVIFMFPLLLAWTFHTQRVTAAQTQQRFCDVTESFIDSNLTLRDAQNQASVVAVGARGDLILTTEQVIRFIKESSTRPPAFTTALLRYLETEIELNRSLNDNAVSTLGASDQATTTWERLKRRLRC